MHIRRALFPVVFPELFLSFFSLLISPFTLLSCFLFILISTNLDPPLLKHQVNVQDHYFSSHRFVDCSLCSFTFISSFSLHFSLAFLSNLFYRCIFVSLSSIISDILLNVLFFVSVSRLILVYLYFSLTFLFCVFSLLLLPFSFDSLRFLSGTSV